MSKIFKSQTHATELVRKVSGLLEGRRRYSDIQIEIDGKIFYCHKIILALQSKYFDAKLYPSNVQTDVGSKIVVEDVCRDDFQLFLNFIYKGEIELNCQNISGVVRAADVLCVSELKKMCAEYILETLYIRNCLRYWRLAERTGVEKAIEACKKLFLEEFAKVVQTCDLGEMTDTMMEAALADSSLSIAREEDICGMFLKWLDVVSRKKPFQSCHLLYHIRWSAVSPEYVKSKLLNNPNIVGNCQCVKFLTNVLSYRHTGMQFEGLTTFHRPSTGIEQCAVIVGLNTGDSISNEMYRVSLQNPCVLTKLQDVPTKMEMEASACVNSNVLFLTGIGPNCRSVYRWDPLSGWGKCGDLMEGRRRHSSTFIGNSALYVLGGYIDDSDKILCSVEQYNPVTNKWLKVGDLTYPTECAACVGYKTFAYLFGGSSREQETDVDIDLDCVQTFDTATKTCTVLCRPLPQPERLLKAVLWQNSAILLNCRACMIFDLDQQTFQQRDAQYAAGVSHFGLVLENQTIFIIGGRMTPQHCSYQKQQQEKDGRGTKDKKETIKDKNKKGSKDKKDKKDKKDGKGGKGAKGGKGGKGGKDGKGGKGGKDGKDGKSKKDAKDAKDNEEPTCPKEPKCRKDENPQDDDDDDDDEAPPCCDEVRSIDVNHLIENCPTANWQMHAKLPTPCLVQACAVLTLPICPPSENEKGKKKDKEDKPKEKSEAADKGSKSKGEQPRKDEQPQKGDKPSTSKESKKR